MAVEQPAPEPAAVGIRLAPDENKWAALAATRSDVDEPIELNHSRDLSRTSRDEEIFNAYASGSNLRVLAQEYCLSHEGVRQIAKRFAERTGKQAEFARAKQINRLSETSRLEFELAETMESAKRDFEEMAAQAEDPRDISPRKLPTLLRWVLENLSWKDDQRRVLLALQISGDCAETAKILNLPLERVERLLRIAKLNLLREARAREWEERFARERLPGGWAFTVNYQLRGESVHFIPLDHICFLFDMNHRRAL